MNTNEYKFLFGIVKIMVTISNQGSDCRKYKHMTEVLIFGKQVFSSVIRSSTTGFYSINVKEIDINIRDIT